MLGLYYSGSGEGLEKKLFELIRQKLEAVASGSSEAKRVLLVVPAQFTLEAERKAFEALGGAGFLDLHVMSGNKLEHDILRETGGPGTVPVNTLGRAMLLRRVSLRHGAELKTFGRLAGKKDFLDLAGDFIVQMKQNGIAAEDIPAMAERCGEGSILRAKLNDMHVIYSAYEEAMAGRFTDSEDLLSFVRGKALESTFIAESEIFYYGFYSFTKSEAAFLTALAKRAAGLSVMLLKGDGSPRDEEVYLAPQKAAELIKREASLSYVRYREEDCPSPALPAPELHLTACASGFTQAETIAARMLELGRKGVGFGEMAVLTADDDSLKKDIAGRLEAFGVPVFMDDKRRLTDDPAVRLCSALLDAAADGYRKDNILGLLKCGLAKEIFGCDELTADDLENYLGRYRVRGKAFAEEFRYGLDRYGEERFAAIDGLRARVVETAAPFLESFRAAAGCADKCRALCEFLADGLGLPALLEAKALELAGLGMTDAAGETEQSWQALTGILDQAAELVGSEPMSAADFRDMIKSSVADVKIGLLPQSENRVQLGSVTRSRISGIRALFVADLNDGVIPSDGKPETLLTQSELEELEELGYTAAKKHSMLSAEEDLQLHMLLREPVEYLFLSWCESDDQGGAANPSRLISEVLDAHPDVAIEQDAEASGSDAPFLQGRENTIARVAGSFRASLDTYGDLRGVSPELAFAYDELLKEAQGEGGASSAAAVRLRSVADALLYVPGNESLGKELASTLYGRGGDLRFSPTEMEQFGNCPFRHFVRYGLRPEDERRFELDHMTTGSVYHEALMRLSKRLSEPSDRAGKEISDPSSLWQTVTDEELSKMLSEILAELADKGFGGILKAGDGERYYSGRILESCMGFARELVRQVRAGRISRMYFETGFGRGMRFPAVTVDTAAGRVYVEGRIDRVDLMKGADGEYIKVIDYKSGVRQFDREEVEKGLSLQLMTYLEGASAMERGEDGEVLPAGVFYFPIRDVTQSADVADVLSGEAEEAVRKAVEKVHRLSGLAVDEPEPLGLIDRGIRESGSSSVIDYKFDEKNGRGKGKNLVSREELEEFRSTFRATLTRICEGISSGETDARPQRLGQGRTSCDYCDYRSVCLFGIGK